MNEMERSFEPNGSRTFEANDKDQRIAELEKELAMLAMENKLLTAVVEAMPFMSVTSEPFQGEARTGSEIETYESSLRFMNRLIDSASVMIVGVDNSGRVVLFNTEAERVSGFCREEVLGTKWLEKLLPSGLFDEMWKDIGDLMLVHEIPVSYENPLVTRSGEIKTVSWRSSTLVDDAMKIVHISFGIDITERMKNDERIRELNSTRDRLFSIIAHDLRGPVGSVWQFLDVMAFDRLKLSDEARARLLKVNANSLNGVRTLLDNLLDWSRVQKADISPLADKICVKEVVRECYELFSGTAAHKKIELAFSDDCDRFIEADERMFKTIVRNLVSNAIKYTCPGGKVVVSASSSGEKVHISVADNGVGMDAATLERLFRPGISKKSAAGTMNESGTGLGLSLCHEFAVRNGGSIRAESSPGAGSRFTVEMPGYTGDPK